MAATAPRRGVSITTRAPPAPTRRHSPFLPYPHRLTTCLGHLMKPRARRLPPVRLPLSNTSTFPRSRKRPRMSPQAAFTALLWRRRSSLGHPGGAWRVAQGMRQTSPQLCGAETTAPRSLPAGIRMGDNYTTNDSSNGHGYLSDVCLHRDEGSSANDHGYIPVARLIAEEEQAVRLHAYNKMARGRGGVGDETESADGSVAAKHLSFLSDTVHTLLPSAVTSWLSRSANAVAQTSSDVVPDNVEGLSKRGGEHDRCQCPATLATQSTSCLTLWVKADSLSHDVRGCKAAVVHRL